MTSKSFHIETIQDAGSDHLTEDALFVGVFEHQIVMVVADGAPQRLRPVNSMRPMLDHFAPRYGADITPSGIAARLTRDTVAEAVTRDPMYPLADAIFAANRHLAEALTAVYGELSARAVLHHEPEFTILAEDERYLRLMLPACTYTAVRVDCQSGAVEVVHGADSALLLFMTDGSIEQVTPDQMKQHDDAFKQLWIKNRDEPAHHPFFRSRGDNRALELNRVNGLFHNYVGPDGTPDPAVGVSVVNGLPEIRHYMFTARRSLADVCAVMVMSDGLFWPEPPLEPADPGARLSMMRATIDSEGLSGYLRALRAEETRLRVSSINPYQVHDDATAALLRL